jgi:hypothetical protein
MRNRSEGELLGGGKSVVVEGFAGAGLIMGCWLSIIVKENAEIG